MRRPERHLVVFDAYPGAYAGTARSAGVLARALPACGWSAEVAVPGEGVVASRLRAAGVAVRVVPAPGALGHFGGSTRGLRALAAAVALPGYWWRLAAVLRRRGGAVLVTSHRSVLLAGPAARLARRPLVWQVSGVTDPASRGERALGAVSRRLANRTIVASPAARLGPARARARQAVVPPPLDPRFGSPPALAPAAPPVVVSVGMLEPAKAHGLLLRAFGLVRERVPTARLRIVGGDKVGHDACAADIRRSAAALGPGAVELAGWAERPEEAWSDAAVYVSASPREGFGLAIAEAMAAGLPAVMTDGTGLAGFLEPGRDAVVVPAGDAAALADAIAGLLVDPEGARAIGRAGREAVAAFHADRVAADLASILDELVPVPAPAGP